MTKAEIPGIPGEPPTVVGCPPAGHPPVCVRVRSVLRGAGKSSRASRSRVFRSIDKIDKLQVDRVRGREWEGRPPRREPCGSAPTAGSVCLRSMQ